MLGDKHMTSLPSPLRLCVSAFPCWPRPQAARSPGMAVLSEKPVVNDTLAGQDLVVVLKDGGHGVRASAPADSLPIMKLLLR
jgi:hypothetical protein